MVKLSVIIVNYNVKYYLEQCLLSLQAAARDFDFEVFVVDNASRDGSVAYLHKRFPKSKCPWLHIIASQRNLGFGKANNLALKRACGEYILFLNPDTVLTEKTLKDCFACVENCPQMGGVGVMMLHDNGRFAYESRRGMPTPWVSFCKMSGLTSLFPNSRIFGKYYMRYLDQESFAEIDIVSGAFLLTKQQVLREVGDFDESFFMYGEDIDLSYRFLQHGYRNYYVPTPILHYKGESTKKNTFKYVHVFYNAMLVFFKKHYHGYWVGIAVPIKVAILMSALFALLRQQLRLLKQFLLPVQKTSDGRMLYIGRHWEKVKSLVADWSLDVNYLAGDESVMPERILPQEANFTSYTHVVYDTGNFSREYILDVFRKSDERKCIGFYHPESGILVTGAKIYTP